MNRMLPLTAVFILAALCACSGMASREARSDRVTRYEVSAGEKVSHFNYFSLQSWEALDEGLLALWTKPNQAWLLTVARPCWELTSANSIGLSSTLGSSVNTMDYVIAAGQRCRITSIRPLDVERLRESRPR